MIVPTMDVTYSYMPISVLSEMCASVLIIIYSVIVVVIVVVAVAGVDHDRVSHRMSHHDMSA